MKLITCMLTKYLSLCYHLKISFQSSFGCLKGRSENYFHFLHHDNTLVEILCLLLSVLLDTVTFLKTQTSIHISLYCCIAGFNGFNVRFPIYRSSVFKHSRMTYPFKTFSLFSKHIKAILMWTQTVLIGSVGAVMRLKERQK